MYVHGIDKLSRLDELEFIYTYYPFIFYTAVFFHVKMYKLTIKSG